MNVTVAPEACSQPVGWDGTDLPALRSVYKAGLEVSSAGPSCGHGRRPHQIVKGQLFLTVKVRNDTGPAFPEIGLGTGVDGVEVGVSDDVAVIARVAILRLREQTFILDDGMCPSRTLSNYFLGLCASWLESAADRHHPS